MPLIDNFRSALFAGGARPNQFKVEFTFPAAIGTPTQDQQLLVTAAALPASNIGVVSVPFRGREVKLAGERTFDPWTVSIVNDSTMSLRNKFEQWSNYMNGYSDNRGITIPLTYLQDLKVTQLDRNDIAIRSYTLTGAFPQSVGEIALSYNSNDVISEFTVTFQYQYFTVTSGS